MEVTYHPIGVIHTPFTDLAEMPIQPTGAASAPGTAEVFSPYAVGLTDLGGFSHVILIYHLHGAAREDLLVTPFLGSRPHGIFATRAPTRPNPIGLSIVELLGIEGNLLHLGNLDILDGTPLLDIKPYVPQFDAPLNARSGWLEHVQRNVKSTKSDARFT
jgi:tRNA-Thr(GGU) m(6)t(6)A37 methyltransferase TsaA